MISIVRTIYSGDLQNSLLLGIPYATKKYSTLNEFLGIAADVSLATTDTPKMRYAAIGNGGHKMVVGSNGIAKIEPIQHTTTDAALYNQIPFVLRAIGNDLSLADQANYGLKKRITVGVGAASADYYAYYLKRLDFTSVASQIQLKAVANGV